ncbi:hypothetical protein [Fodinibius sediminis]|uniref:Uncharacterized protein n=1 Tax=Fodinibius sediminis TaxID=1214077 RepID=A0A521DGJ3_9BACT|nr:hypothetical protein [Fodinibius sediminis]SMO70884.1 hypothetical protein SAMN06265218_11069 [Fodinibius sediminis]
MKHSELSHKNFRRINIINWLLCLPLLLLFTWPYIYIARYLMIQDVLMYAGAAFFAVPFMITILHGHVTMVLGSAHRHHYYNWLTDYPLTFGLLFHPLMMRTRFRLVLLIVSLVFFAAGWILAGR